jgi:FtsP/CotA-like multicopper oxidase with cupredoxin domain
MKSTRDTMRTIVALAALLLTPQLAIAQVVAVDYYNEPNYSVSKLPQATCRDALGVVTPGILCQKDADCPGYLTPIIIGAWTFPGGATCTGPVVVGTGIKKFVDTLPVLCGVPVAPETVAKKNTLGNCLPLAVPDTTTFPGDDYYELGVSEYATRFHSDLKNPAKQRGFYQINTTIGSDPNLNYFLGPIILGTSYRPVRMKFVNQVPTGAAGDLFLPTDTSLPGTNTGPDGLPYTQNRVAVHLHGGNSPWISDGTQHQWTVPAGEATTHKKGLAVKYVPDMWFDASGTVIAACAGLMTCPVLGASNNPGDGQLSFYWPNEQSGRLMFYHDHAYGITRLNVMAGMAAGFLLVNPPDEDALFAAGVPGTIGSSAATTDLAHLIPLIIQDRTFVPPAAQLAVYDKTWDSAKWGGEDSVWYPHVYTPNQWLDNPDGSATNAFGRWDYGPYFWPPQQTLTSVDGAPRPLTEPCTTMAGVAAGGAPFSTTCPTTPLPSLTPESFLDTPIVNGTAYPTITVAPVRYRFQILNAANDRYWNLSFFVADTVTPNNTEVKMVNALPGYLPNYAYTGLVSAPEMCDPLLPISQVTGLPVQDPLAPCYPSRWPTDARQGGAPDPAAAGPRWVQIGTEGGILPAAAVIAPLPTVYEMNKRNIVVTNVADHSLFLGPAERADVVVDFSQYAGKTLILYSDSPAPVPAGDPRSDFFTWGPDMTSTGGSPTPLPGYGPNIRTIMQVVVTSGTPQSPPLNDAEVARITTALQQQFPVSQLRPIVPEAVFSNMYAPLTVYTNTYLPISTQSLVFTPVGTTMPVDMPFQWKALHELFSTDFGRMNSVLAVEIPATTWLVQTTIPYGNMDPATEFIDDNVPALWKVTHNGVDTHAIHFHLMNVQIINRVGWDGQIRPPDDNERGWKDTVRMNPLEDIYLALQPVKQHLPWPQPDMVRPLDVDRPLGTFTQFTGVDIFNNPINITNQLFNFGQEYVWHCHLLGHEENDMLRAEVFVVAPEDPTGLIAILVLKPSRQAKLSWQDNSMSAMNFTVERDTDPNFLAPVAFVAPRPATQPGPVTFTDPGPLAAITYYYRVRAEKMLSTPAIPGVTWSAWSAWSAWATAGISPIASLNLASIAFGNQAVPVTSGSRKVTLSNIGTDTLNIASIGYTGANPSDFVIVSTTCGATLAVGAACDINVAFKPLTPGVKVAALSILTNSIIGPTQTVAVTGTGVAPVAAINPTSLVFASQAVNTTSAAKVVVLTNNGSAWLFNIIVTSTGPFGRQWSGVNTCTGSLAPNTSCNIFVTFSPKAGGALAGTIVIASSDPVHPTLTVTTSGTGTFTKASSATLTSSRPSPVLPGTSVTFTAAGAGAGVGAVYYYRFSLFNGIAWSVVQPFGAATTWAWAIQPFDMPANYSIKVEVTTNLAGAVADVTKTLTPFTVVRLPLATGVTLTATPASPQTVVPGLSVVFTGAGQGYTGYAYQFLLIDVTNGVSYLVQDWSPAATWTWNSTVVPPPAARTSAWQVIVNARTSPWQTLPATKTLNYTIN